jgi:hypothetical protein
MARARAALGVENLGYFPIFLTENIFLFLLPFPSPFGRLRRAFLFWEGLFVFWERKGRVGKVR